MKKFLTPRVAIGSVVAVAALGLAGVVSAAGLSVVIKGDARTSPAQLSCPGGMTRLGHVFDANASVFPGDPSPIITKTFDYPDGFLLETITTGTHTGTHLSAPGHFIEGAPTIDDLAAKDFSWPVYVIDVRSRVNTNPDFSVTRQDIKSYESKNGKIASGSLVVLFTGFQSRFATPAYLDTAPGFTADAITYMFTDRLIKGVGTDTFGPDASSDVDFSASTEIYTRGGITIENMRGLEKLHIRGDVVIAPTTALRDGSGFLTDPIGCLRG